MSKVQEGNIVQITKFMDNNGKRIKMSTSFGRVVSIDDDSNIDVKIGGDSGSYIQRIRDTSIRIEIVEVEILIPQSEVENTMRELEEYKKKSEAIDLEKAWKTRYRVALESANKKLESLGLARICVPKDKKICPECAGGRGWYTDDLFGDVTWDICGLCHGGGTIDDD